MFVWLLTKEKPRKIRRCISNCRKIKMVLFLMTSLMLQYTIKFILNPDSWMMMIEVFMIIKEIIKKKIFNDQSILYTCVILSSFVFLILVIYSVGVKLYSIVLSIKVCYVLLLFCFGFFSSSSFSHLRKSRLNILNK